METFPRRHFPPALARGIGAVALGASMTTAAVFGIADYIVRRITKPASHLHYEFYTYTPWELGMPWQDVSIPVADGSLAAWLIPAARADAPLIIPLAGHGGNKGDLLGIARYLWQEGFTCLLFDYRGSGMSAGRGSTLGFRETEDTLAAIDWAARNVPDRSVGLIGYSMGGAIAILAAARDERVRGVVSDCGFASQRNVIDHQVRRTLRVPSAPIVAAANRLMERRQGFRFDHVEPRAQVQRIAPRPLFVIHGGRDDVVPVSHARELYAAAGEPKRLWIIEDAPHVGGYFVDRPTYCRAVAGFFADALGFERWPEAAPVNPAAGN